MVKFYGSYDSLKKRVEALEKLLSLRGTRALAKCVTPQPLEGEKFHTYYAMEFLFKKWLEVHDAKKNVEDNFDFVRSYENGMTPDYTPLYEPLGELIILAVTYLERIGCNAELRQLLFEKLNRRNVE